MYYNLFQILSCIQGNDFQWPVIFGLCLEWLISIRSSFRVSGFSQDYFCSCKLEGKVIRHNGCPLLEILNSCSRTLHVALAACPCLVLKATRGQLGPVHCDSAAQWAVGGRQGLSSRTASSGGFISRDICTDDKLARVTAFSPQADGDQCSQVLFSA